MDFVGGGSGGLGSDNGPILFSEPNRTSAIDDLRSLVIYIFIITIFISFFLILPGIRNDKLPTFLCIIPSLIVTSIILISLFGTTWHVGQASISAPYKAFSKDRIQGELSVKIGLRSVNITLRAHKYYELHASHKPVILDDFPPPIDLVPTTTTTTTTTSTTKRPTNNQRATSANPLNSANNLAEELLGVRGPDVAETEEDEADFADAASADTPTQVQPSGEGGKFHKRSTSRTASQQLAANSTGNITTRATTTSRVNTVLHKYTIERSNVDINYNERFYWIEPNQMRKEHHNALERGLPYPILTVVEYLSQDEAGFSWSRQYRLAGYYSHVILWLSLCVCVLMFFLHCAAPKYGIYTMQCLGCLLLFTNFTYATLVPRGDQKLVIPFEGRSLSLQFGWNYWLVMIGGCLSLAVGTLIVIIDGLFPNFIFTTILDVDFDSHNQYSYKNRNKRQAAGPTPKSALERPTKPPFYDDSTANSKVADGEKPPTQAEGAKTDATHRRPSFKQVTSGGRGMLQEGDEKDVVSASSSLSQQPLFPGPLIRRTPLTKATFLPKPNADSQANDSEIATKRGQHSSVVEMPTLSADDGTQHSIGGRQGGKSNSRNHHYGKNQQQQQGGPTTSRKNSNPKNTDHESQRERRKQQVADDPNDQVRL